MSVEIPITVATLSLAMYLIGFLMLSAVIIFDESSSRDPDYLKGILLAAGWPLIGLLQMYYAIKTNL